MNHGSDACVENPVNSGLFHLQEGKPYLTTYKDYMNAGTDTKDGGGPGPTCHTCGKKLTSHVFCM